MNLGMLFHVYSFKMGFDSDISLVNTLIALYGKCGHVDIARSLFDRMAVKSVVSWNSIIAAYEQNKAGADAIKLFRRMQRENVEYDYITMVSVISACSSMGALTTGKWVHDLVRSKGLETNVSVTSALIDMYAKCGNIDLARDVFGRLRCRSVVSWTSIIAACASHGHGEDAVLLFTNMKEEGIRPNIFTFTAVLTACRHSGLVEEGRKHFESMTRDFLIVPGIEQCACMVDLLGRAGELLEAYMFINNMPIDAYVWGALLGACSIHGNLELAEHVADRLYKLNPQSISSYSLMVNLYAEAGRWEDVARMRKLIEEREPKKFPSPSSIETDGSVPNTLVIANCEIVKPRVAAAEHISQFNEESRSPFVKKFKTILHPGEVNRIRELPQNSNIVATHTDSPDVLIWDIESQPNRQATLGNPVSRPDLILTGHKDNAEFALAMSPTEPFVLSGGKDRSVILWGIQDHISTLAADPGSKKSSGTGGIKTSKGDVSDDTPSSSPSVQARGTFQGHGNTVEDVQFCPSSAQEFCSVGDDSCLILWDARSGFTPVVKVEKAHDADLHCVDWNPRDVNLILTGSADNSVRMFDRRNLTSGPIHIFEGHSEAVLCVQWSPDRSSVFGSSAEDGILNMWDHKLIDQPDNPKGLFFRHAGHRDKVVDFHFNSSDPWTIVSVSDDCESTNGGGTLQIWRMLDLLYKPEEEALADLEKFKSHLLSCSS